MTNGQPGPAPVVDRRLPPIAELTVMSLILMLTGGIYLASYLPRQPALGPAIALAVGGGLLTITATVLLSRIRPFAWNIFFLVGRWALMAYAVVAGMLAFVFIYDHTSGTTLAILVFALAVFAIDVPMIIAFTVARYDQTHETGPIS